MWSYVQTIFTSSLKPPNEYYLNVKEMDNFILLKDNESKSKFLEQLIDQKDLIALCRNANGSVRFCDICCCIKPDRSHHCSSCDSCILKMDHHCPWVNNCVGFHNYKYFVLFLLHGVTYCAYILVSSSRYFVAYWKNQSKIDNHILGFNLVFLFLVAFLFMVALMSLGGYHIFLVLKNQTTLESFRRPYLAGSLSPIKEVFNIGVKMNFYQVFGDVGKYWCVPVKTNKGDGILFQTRHYRQVEFQSMINDV